ncbi:MAG: DMT family transporter [Lutibacter sp.]|jgi:drug/metabolite transporter (DMT)-like permease|nr:DMT family transporter [Lutibacter sp.]
MDHKQLRWVYLLALALIWGSSFILMKRALIGMTPIQLGALRILISAVLLLLIGFRRVSLIKRRHWPYLVVNALIGTFFPAFLFAYALDKMDSAIAAILNSLTPLQTLIFGALFFGFGFRKRQLLGVLIGLAGTVLLIVKGAELHPNQDYFYALLIVIASVGYAINVNILKKYLHDLDALSITVGNFLVLILPVLAVLYLADFSATFVWDKAGMNALFYVSILAILGTGVAKLMFNRLVQLSSPVFSSSVTYLIPLVAVFWGLLDGETVTFSQFSYGLLILLGVYMANKSR